MPIKFHKLYDDAILPRRQTAGSAGYDLYYYGKNKVRLWKGERRLFATGVALELSSSEFRLCGDVRPRSGLALKQGVTVLNTPGLIDADYYPREIGVILINHGEESVEIRPGDRIAQLVITEYFITDDDLSVDQERSGGFGSTEEK